jgi:hypothetical protein
MKSKPVSNSGKASEYKCRFVGRLYKKATSTKMSQNIDAVS